MWLPQGSAEELCETQHPICNVCFNRGHQSCLLEQNCTCGTALGKCPWNRLDMTFKIIQSSHEPDPAKSTLNHVPRCHLGCSSSLCQGLVTGLEQRGTHPTGVGELAFAVTSSFLEPPGCESTYSTSGWCFRAWLDLRRQLMPVLCAKKLGETLH